MLQLDVLHQFLQQNPSYFIAAVLVVSLMVGSFLNVVIYRLPLMMEQDFKHEYHDYFHPEQQPLPRERFNLAVPNSRCPHCKHPLAIHDNIPLLSWALLKGRCRYCQAPISVRYPAIEALTAVLSGVVAWYYGASSMGYLGVILTWVLVTLSFIDIDKMLLPDEITQPTLWGLLLAAVMGWTTITAEQAVIGAVAGYLSLWTVFWAYKLPTGKEGFGYGDFKLMAIFGALLGWQLLPQIILLSSLVGAVIGGSVMLLNKSGRDTKIPFGPYIAAAGWIALVWGQDINQWYLRSIGL